jgi:hypothetical protein
MAIQTKNASDAATASSRRSQRLLLLACVPLPFLAFSWALRLPEPFASAMEGLRGHEASLRSGSGILQEEEASLRARLDERGLVVVYFPLDVIAPDARVPLVEMLESRTQIYRNLLYPTPRDVRMAISAAEIEAALLGFDGRVAVVVDLRQDGGPAPVANCELVHERSEEVRVRHWLVRGGPR